MKKIFLLISALAIILALTASCSFGSKNTLTLMGRKSDLEKSYMKSVFERYEVATGNKIKLISYEDSEFEAKAAEAFKKDDAPDILMHFNNSDLERFDVENDFYILNDEPWVFDLTDSANAYCRDENGNLLGLPFWESSVSGCYYNKTLLDSLGLRPATTQAEFDMLCDALSETGLTPICWPANGCSWMVQFGLDPVFADNPQNLEKLNNGKIKFEDIPEIYGMVQWISDACEKGWFGSDYLNTGWNEISPAMSKGNCVMTFIWDTWFYTDFVPDKYTIDDFALMPIFMNTANSGTYEGGNLNMMMVGKNSDKLEDALDFLNFCADPENYNAAFDGIATVSCFKGQTTNIQSKMVADASASVAENERVSTASSKIKGYNADDMVSAINELLKKKTDVKGCIEKMDMLRLSEAGSEAARGS